jgi:hypothetical protein
MDHPERLYQVVADGLPARFPGPRTNAPVPVGPSRQTELADRINDYVEKSIAEAFAGGAQPTPLETMKAVLELPSDKKRDVTGERDVTGRLAELLLIAFGFVGLAWVIKILFF